ncbi:MAG: aspartate carbamoyltransferase catalytic subunit [Oscillospiraceae bacterium]|nr:aspartate carbamoyltransferase catalytic subunit [Oscillospiraceae bacterium]
MFGNSKDLLGIRDLPVSEIQEILDRTAEMKKIVMSQNRKTTDLAGRTVNILFYENSTRTRLSFEMGAKMMSSVACNISASGSSVTKKENLIDTARTIDVMQTDILIMRHGLSGAPHLVAKNVNAAVINGGDGTHEHPTQALLDAYTIIEKKGDLKGLKVVIVGDIAHSRVARSNIWLLTKMGAKVSICAPKTLIPSGIEQMGVTVYNDVEVALKDADVVMGLRIQLERQKGGYFPDLVEYAKEFGINEKRLKLAKSDAIVLHPGPVNREVEITSFVYDCDQSVIDEQVTNGVAIRMAIMKKAIER